MQCWSSRSLPPKPVLNVVTPANGCRAGQAIFLQGDKGMPHEPFGCFSCKKIACSSRDSGAMPQKL